MTETITVKRLRARTLFKVYFLGCFLTMTPFCILIGVTSQFGVGTITMGDKVMHGLPALVESIFLGPLFALVFAFLSLLTVWPGLWILSKFRKLEISFYTETKNNP